MKRRSNSCWNEEIKAPYIIAIYRYPHIKNRFAKLFCSALLIGGLRRVLTTFATHHHCKAHVRRVDSSWCFWFLGLPDLLTLIDITDLGGFLFLDWASTTDDNLGFKVGVDGTSSQKGCVLDINTSNNYKNLKLYTSLIYSKKDLLGSLTSEFIWSDEIFAHSNFRMIRIRTYPMNQQLFDLARTTLQRTSSWKFSRVCKETRTSWEFLATRFKMVFSGKWDDDGFSKLLDKWRCIKKCLKLFFICPKAAVRVANYHIVCH